MSREPEEHQVTPEVLRERDAREAAAPIQAFGALPSDRRYKLGRARFPLMADALAALAGDGPPRVLDAGIGQAKLQRVYASQHPDRPVRWVGLDRLGFRLALRQELEGIERVQADLATLPFVEGAFDAVACSWVFQHLDDPEGALRELTRVLRPGGLLLLAVPQRPQPIKLLAEVLHPLWTWIQRRAGKQFAYNPQLQFYDRPRVRRLLRAAGLEAPRWQGIGFVTGGPLKPLENWRWYYDLNLALGRWVPGFTQTLLVVARRPVCDAGGLRPPDPPLLR